MADNPYGNKDKESPNGADEEKEEEKVATVVLGYFIPTVEIPPLVIKDEMQEMFLRLGFSQTIAQKLVEDQGISSP